MPSQLTTDTLPNESEMNRKDMLSAFIAVVNICEPEHPYQRSYKNNIYPIDPNEVKFSWCSAYYAKCGPGNSIYKANYSVNSDYINEISTERHLALLTHEVSHITEGRHSSSKTHPKAFWKEMAFNAWDVRENWADVVDTFGVCYKEKYIQEVIEDPNSSTVDRRMETVDERREKQADLLGEEYSG